jgi:integrase
VAVTTALRVSELLGLKWSDIDVAAGEIHLYRGVVRQHVGEMKTEASRKPVPLDSQLAEVLIMWRSVCPYNRDEDYIFASPDMRNGQPEGHDRRHAIRALTIELQKEIEAVFPSSGEMV